jgi:hypothetical protein
MTTGSTLLSTLIPPIVATAVVTQTVKTVFPRSGKGTGKSVCHWHYKGKAGNKAVKHCHPGGGMSHMHRGLPGYGKKKSTLRR